MPVKQIVDRGLGTARHVSRTAGRTGRRAGSFAAGMVSRVRDSRSGPNPELNDPAIARKVESVIFRDADAPKQDVDVNVVDGVVYLRGVVKHPEDVRELERRTKAIPEVKGVENLLHLPKTPAPTRADTPRRQQRTGAPRAAAKVDRR
jgi:osmotically-inducible protein OsmY